MLRQRVGIWLLVLVLHGAPARAEQPDKDGFVPLFNGKDLTGWVSVNGAPSTWSVKDEMIITTGKPIGYMRTAKQYENFILEFEWMHVPPKPDAVGNSGLFVWCDPLPAVGTGYSRGIEVQVLVNLEKEDQYTSHGDLFSIHGATCVPDRPHPKGWARCLPSERRCKGANEWNHYRVEGNDGRLTLAVNGKVVSGVGKCNPRKGYLALEAEGSECRFRNLKIKELTSTNPKPEEVARVAEGFVPLYTGLDLSGWKVEEGHTGHWKAEGTVLKYDGKATGQESNLWTAKVYQDFELLLDWRLSAKPEKKKLPRILPTGEETEEQIEVPDAGGSGISLRGDPKALVSLWCWPVGSGEVHDFRTDKNMPAEVRAGATPKIKADKPPGQWNRLLIRLKGDRITVTLNGQLVIEEARLPGVREKGAIGMQDHSAPVDFANLFIRELK